MTGSLAKPSMKKPLPETGILAIDMRVFGRHSSEGKSTDALGRPWEELSAVFLQGMWNAVIWFGEIIRPR